MLPVRIELTTSALPRMRSTTELRQHTTHLTGDVVHPAALEAGLWPWARANVKVPCPSDAIFAMMGRMRENEEAKKKRLAEALRANLRRRKVQGKAQDLPVPSGDPLPD